jgi:hypothetical protein
MQTTIAMSAHARVEASTVRQQSAMFKAAISPGDVCDSNRTSQTLNLEQKAGLGAHFAGFGPGLGLDVSTSSINPQLRSISGSGSV